MGIWGRRCLQWLLLATTLITVHAQCPAPTPCRCEYVSNKHIINCRNKQLTTIPTFTTSSTAYYELTLAKNDITDIPANAFAGVNIERLDMQNNPLLTISEQAFRGLENTLKEACLSTDQMSTFPLTALSILTNLELLILNKFNLMTFPSNGLSSLSKLREFQMTESGLESLPSNVFSSQLTTLEKIILSDNALSDIPAGAINNLQVLGNLSLVANNIRVIAANTFATMRSIRSLDLSQNGITTIHTDAFLGLEDKIQTLSMKLCHLNDQSLPPLKILTSLQTLDLSDNPQISNIAPDFFDNLRHLQFFSVQDCGVHGLTSQTFDGLNTLEMLNIRSNNLNSIGPRTFSSLDSLSSLDLGKNLKLNSELAPGVFTGIENTLSNLDLSNTGLQKNRWATISPLTKLTTLSLGGNALEEIPEFIFQNMSRLAVLRLDSNELQTVTQRQLHGLGNSLVTLHLDNNSIVTLDQCAFNGFEELNLLKLNLNNNPLNCDCRLSWLLSELKAHQDFEVSKWGIQWTCDAPVGLKGKPFVNLEISQLQCDQPTTTQPCEDFTPTTTTHMTSTPYSTTQSIAASFRTDITDITISTLTVTWTIRSVDNVEGFTITAAPDVNSNEEKILHTNKQARSAVIDELIPGTKYVICVQPDTSSGRPINKTCDTVYTLADTGAQKEDLNILAISLGCGLGGCVLLITIIVLLCMLRRRAVAKKKRSLPPAQGYSSKTFIRKRSSDDSASQASFRGDSAVSIADHFSKNEQEQIMRMYVAAGGSIATMASMASLASVASVGSIGRRYVHDFQPQPHIMDHYIRTNPEERDDPSKHIYSEIPDDNYQEIPADHFV